MRETRSATKKKQTRLAFAPIPSSSPVAAAFANETQRQVAAVRYEQPLTPSKLPRIALSSPLKFKSSPESSRDGKMALPTPAPSSQMVQKDSEDSDSTQSESEIPVSSSTFGRFSRPRTRGSNTLLLTPQSTKANGISPFQKLGSAGEGASAEVDSDDEEPLSSPRKRRATPSANLRSSTRLRNKPKAKATTFDETTKLESGEQKPLSRKLRRKLSFSGSTINSSADDDDLKLSSSKRNKEKTAPIRATGSPSSEESSEDLVGPQRRRRLTTRNIPDSPAADSDSDVFQKQAAHDLEEDLNDLRDSDIRKRRTRGKVVNTERSNRQKQLEVLKRRRSGGKIIELSSDTEALASSEPRPSLDEQEVYDQSSENEDSEEDQDSIADAVRKSLRADADENDSCVDDDGLLGAHGLEDIPFEFTRHAHKKPLEHFKDAVEWMVHNKLNPAFPRNDVIYQIAFRKINDEVHGYSGSKFVSSVWNANFLKNLKTLPELSAMAVPTMHDHKCDACNRSKHPAKHSLVFSGKAYNIDTLEDIEEDEEDDDDDDDGKIQHAAGTDQSRPFYLGRACAANAETAHNLLHWKHHLNHYVLNWLKNHGHTTADKIIERENWSTKKRSKYANDVVDGMVASGEMRILYKEFKENLDAARSARPERFAYGRQ